MSAFAVVGMPSSCAEEGTAAIERVDTLAGEVGASTRKRGQPADVTSGTIAPKRPLNAFMHFSRAKRLSIQEEHPSSSVANVAKNLGEAWRGMSADNKQEWEDLAAQDKERYQLEVASTQDDGDGMRQMIPRKSSKHARLLAVRQHRCEARAGRQQSRLLKKTNVRAALL